MHLITLSGLMFDTALSLRSSLQSTNTIQGRRRRQHPITVHTDAQGRRHASIAGGACGIKTTSRRKANSASQPGWPMKLISRDVSSGNVGANANGHGGCIQRRMAAQPANRSRRQSPTALKSQRTQSAATNIPRARAPLGIDML